MIKVGFCEKAEFIKRTKNKKIYCFGAGRRFQHFVEKHYVDSIEAVLDNYRYKEDTEVKVAGMTILVISIEQLRQKIDKNIAIVITCLAVNEILAQIESVKELDSVECYIEFLIGEENEDYGKKMRRHLLRNIKFGSMCQKKILPVVRHLAI